MIAAEETAVKEYESTTKENEITKATKEQDAKYKTKEAKGLDKETAEATADRTGVQEELDAVNEYYTGYTPTLLKFLIKLMLQVADLF